MEGRRSTIWAVAVVIFLAVSVARAEEYEVEPDSDRRICRLFRYTRDFIRTTPDDLEGERIATDAAVGAGAAAVAGTATYWSLTYLSWRQELARRAAMGRAAEAARAASVGYRTAAISEGAAAEAAGARYFVLGEEAIFGASVAVGAVALIGGMVVADNLLFPDTAGGDTAERIAEKLEDDPFPLYTLSNDDACNILVYFPEVRVAWEQMIVERAARHSRERREMAEELIRWARNNGDFRLSEEIPLAAIRDARYAAAEYLEPVGFENEGVTALTGPAGVAEGR